MSRRDHSHRLLTRDQLTALAEYEPPWRCADLAADGFVTILAGQGGEGKSWLTMALAGGILQGSTIAGIKCEPGRVAIFDAENGPPLIASRLKAAGIPLEHLDVYDADGIDLRLDAEWIASRLDGIDLAVLDSLRSLAPNAKENDSDDMAPVVATVRTIARNTNTAIIMPHHRDKHDHADYRGSGAIRDQTDLMFVLGRAPGDPDGRHRRYLRTSKCRIAEEPDERWIRLTSFHGAVAFAEADPYNGGRGAPRQQDAAGQLAEVLDDQPARLAVLAGRAGLDPRSGTTRRAMDKLVADDIAMKEGDTYRRATRCATSAPAAHQAAQGQGEGDAPLRHPLKGGAAHDAASDIGASERVAGVTRPGQNSEGAR